MTDDDKHGIVILAVFLAVWWWQKGRGDVTLKTTCIFPDGFEIDIPISDLCPYDASHGGQSIPKPV